jgi:acyl carrier protein
VDNDASTRIGSSSGQTSLIDTIDTTTMVAPPRRLHEDEVMTTLRQIVADVLRVPTDLVAPDSTLTDLPYVESIKLLRIAGKLERRFEIELENEALFRKGTLRDLAREIVTVTELSR